MNATVSRVALGALILVNVALGGLAVQLAAGKVPIPESWAWAVPVLVAVVTAATALLPRAGSEMIAAQVDSLRADGVPRSEMIVLPRDQAAVAVAGNGTVMTPAQVAQIVAAVKVEMTRDPEGDDPPAQQSIGDQIGGIIDKSEQQAGRG